MRTLSVHCCLGWLLQTVYLCSISCAAAHQAHESTTRYGTKGGDRSTGSGLLFWVHTPHRTAPQRTVKPRGAAEYECVCVCMRVP